MAGKIVFESAPVALTIRSRPRPAANLRRPPPLPVIVGCPRSGTSLLAVMLDSHPELAVPPETSFVAHLPGLAGDAEDLRREFFDTVTADRLAVSNWSDFGLDKEAFRRRIDAIEPFTVTAALRAFYAMYAQSEGKPRCGEKTPGYVFQMPEIAALLPEAHFIHVIRDPGDTALSWRKTWFAPSQDLRVLGQEWRRAVEAGRRGSKRVRGYLEVRFEELILRPEQTLRGVCEVLSLAFDACMLDYGARGAARIARLQGREQTAGPPIDRELRTRIHGHLTRPPDATRLGVWRGEMSADERRALEEAAGPLVRELGYAA